MRGVLAHHKGLYIYLPCPRHEVDIHPLYSLFSVILSYPSYPAIMSNSYNAFSDGQHSSAWTYGHGMAQSSSQFAPTAPDWNLLHQNHDSFQVAAVRSSDISPHEIQQSNTPAKPKRAPKAPTMSAGKWAPCKGRVKQLYVDERKS